MYTVRHTYRGDEHERMQPSVSDEPRGALGPRRGASGELGKSAQACGDETVLRTVAP